MRLQPDHREHLRKSGLTDETIEAAGIYSITDPAEAARLLNWKGNGPVPALVLRNFDRAGNENGNYLRPDHPRVDQKGKPIKYESPLESSPKLYFPPPSLLARARLMDPSEPLLLTEGIKKCLAIIQAGAVSVSAQGVAVWHDITFKKETGRYRLHPDFEGTPLRGRIVYGAFDGGDTSSNPPVVAAEARLGRMLLDVGAGVRLLRIPFEPGGPKIGLDDFLAGLAAPAEALAKLMAEAIPADPILRVQALEAMPDKISAAARLLKDWSFAAALREADRATFDLVAAELHRLVKITKAALEEAIERFSQQLRPTAHSKAADAPAYPPELIKKAEELLRDPKLLDRFHASLARDGIVGERKAATTILLAAVTRKTKRPVHLVLKAASSSGKNHVVKHVVARLPVEEVLEVTDMSPRALQYLPGSLKAKVVVIAEHEGAERAEYSLRIVMSEGSLSILTAEKVSDGEGSHIESRKHVVEGPCSVITTTTRSSLHDENETRVLEVTLDETPEQTRRIIDAHALRVEQPPSPADEEEATAERDVWRCALGLLEATETINAFASKLAAGFPVGRVRARRDFPRLLDLAAAHALLHQRQRQRGPDGRVVVEMQDVAAAQKLCQALFSEVSLRLRTVATKLWAKFGTGEFTPAEASKALGDSIDDARRLLREMGDAELVECVQEHKGSKPSRWKLAGEPDCPTEPDFEPCRTNSAETTGETTDPDCPTDAAGNGNGTGTGDQPVDQQPAVDPGRTVGQTDFCNDSSQVTPTPRRVGQSRAVGQHGYGAPAPEHSAAPASPPSPGAVNGSKTAAFTIIDVLPGETESQAEARCYAREAAWRIAAADRAEAERLRRLGQLEDARRFEESAAEAEKWAAS